MADILILRFIDYLGHLILPVNSNPLPRITWATAYATNPVTLTWNEQRACTNFGRYFVYRSTLPGTTNLSWQNPSSRIWQTNNANGTNFINNINYGSNYYYHITSLDTTTPFTNESWYSTNVTAFATLYQGPFFVSTNSIIASDGNIGSLTAPFRTIQHAANVMAPGPIAGITSATTYIEPGIYYSKVVIKSNKNSGYMAFIASNAATRPILSGLTLSNSAFILTNVNKIYLSDLVITRYTNGIIIKGTSTNNKIRNSRISSNLNNGIYLFGNNVNKNYIIHNAIFSNRNAGISLSNAIYNVIDKSNKIYLNNQNGIYLSGSAQSNYISGNIIYTNNNQNGIYFNGANVRNNTITSNSIYAQANGINLASSFNNYIQNNTQIYNNNNAGIYFTGTAQNNVITGNSIYNNNNNFYGIYFAGANVRNNTIYSNYIYYLARGIWFASAAYQNHIQKNNIYKNGTFGIYFTGTSESNYITANQIYSNSTDGIILTGTSTSVKYNIISSNYIYGPGQNYGISLVDAGNNYIQYSNRIYNNKNAGIYLNYFSGPPTQSNIIINNYIYSNKSGGNPQSGIWFANTNVISYNNITNNLIFGQTYGINFTNASKNYIQNNNKIYKNTLYGISIQGIAQANLIKANQIYSNTSAGVFFGNAANNAVKSNNVFGPVQKYGIYINNAKGVTNYGNNVYNNTNGIYMVNSTNSMIYKNKIQNGLIANGNGIFYFNSSSSIQQNTITNNINGVKFLSGNSQQITKNNIFDNTTNFNNLSGFGTKITNNWWNSTIASTNARRIKNNGGYSNFTIYRLFGPFDITSTNVNPLPRITWATAVVNGTQVTLTWHKQQGSPFGRYFVYRSTTPGTTNLSWQNPSSRIWQTNNANGTNFINNINYGSNYYYHITSLDTTTPFTNESWYSTNVTVSAVQYTGPYYVATNILASDLNPGTKTAPFRTIQHAANVIMPGVTFATAYIYPGLYNEQSLFSPIRMPDTWY